MRDGTVSRAPVALARRKCVQVLAMAWGLVAWGTPFLASAQDAVRPQDEFRLKVRVGQDETPPGENPFGEKLNLVTGDLSFEQVDIHLTGTGPAIDVARTFAMRDTAYAPSGYESAAFGDWELSLPRITTVVAQQQDVHGWVVGQSTPQGWSTSRCSQFAAPPTVAAANGVSSAWDPKDWWNGYQLVLPGAGSQDLLSRDAGNPLVPDGSNIRIVTKAHWVVSCLPMTANGEPGEAFVATAPDGSRYWFNQLTYGFAPKIARAGTPTDTLARAQASMLVTRVEDRFGNAVDYRYDGNRLTQITASDGRQVSFDYVGRTPRIQSVNVQSGSFPGRAWRYQYRSNGTQAGGPLDNISLPDGSRWTFDLAAMRDIRLADKYQVGDCDTPASVPGGFNPTQVVSMTNPSGLTGTYTLAFQARSRAFTPKHCDTKTNAADIPSTWVTLGLATRRLSGAGVDATWNYRYSPPTPSWSDCAGSCPAMVWTDVVAPDGRYDHHVFSSRYDGTEGQRLSVETRDSQGLRRMETYAYAEPDGGPWPRRAGRNLMPMDNEDRTAQHRPLRRRDIVQEGVTYTWNVIEFDPFLHPIRSTRSNTQPEQIVLDQSEQVLNHTGRWVLGLPLRTVNNTTNEEVDRLVYDPWALLPTERYRFGRRTMGYAYDSRGQMIRQIDGIGRPTTFGNYKRGIPGSVSYPDGRLLQVDVDNLGQVIRVGDQTGVSTFYGYDPIGRLARIDYPSGDSVSWAPKTIQYTFSTEGYPLNGPHWTRTVTQANRSERTEYDAMLRPVLQSRSDANGTVSVSSRTDYDWQGRPIFQSYPFDGNSSSWPASTGTSLRYDVLGRLVREARNAEQGELATTTAYPDGGARRVTNPMGAVTTTRYQMFDEPSYDKAIAIEAREGVLQLIQRDVYGNPVSVSRGGNFVPFLRRTMSYDSAHRLCRVWEPESGSEIMSHDDVGNLVWSVNGASFNGTGCGEDQIADAMKTVRSYDPMNRLLSVTYPGTGIAPTSYTYDSRGNLDSVMSGTVSRRYTRNKLGLPTSEVLTVDNQSWAFGYGYDPNGALSSIAYPDGDVVTYMPNGLGQAQAAGRYASNVRYFADGEPRTYGLGNGATYMADKNPRQLLRNFTYGYGMPTISEDLYYDFNGNLSYINDLTQGGQRTRSMRYDSLDRLISVDAGSAGGSEMYDYDALDNIRTLASGNVVNTYSYDSLNLLRSISNGTTYRSFVYDNRGNTIRKGDQELGFDYANRMVSVTGKASYVYDEAGRRVKKTTPQGTTYYVYNTAGQLLWQYDPATSRGTKYVYLGKKLIASTAPNQGAVYYYTDPQGSVLATTDDRANLTSTSDWRPFGARSMGTPGSGPGYMGELEEADTGLVYLKGRYYDPTIGRFMSRSYTSPVPEPFGDFNRFGYPGNNPFTHGLVPDVALPSSWPGPRSP